MLKILLIIWAVALKQLLVNLAVFGQWLMTFVLAQIPQCQHPQLHNQLEGWPSVQCHCAQTQVIDFFLCLIYLLHIMKFTLFSVATYNWYGEVFFTSLPKLCSLTYSKIRIMLFFGILGCFFYLGLFSPPFILQLPVRVKIWKYHREWDDLDHRNNNPLIFYEKPHMPVWKQVT